MTAAGWYPDLASDEVIRYWDGERWTEERAWDGSGWVDRALGSTIQETAGPAPHTGGPARNLNETVVGGLIETSDPIAASSPPPAPPAASVDSTFVESAPAPPAASVDSTFVESAPAPPAASVDSTFVESAPAPPAASVDSTFVESAPAPPGASVVVPPPLPMPGGGPPSERSRGRLLFIVALGLAAALVSAAVTFLVIRAGDNSGASPAEPSTTRRTVAASATGSSASSTTLQSTTTTVLPASAPVEGRVARTCGAGGNGDCFLSVRSTPTGGSVEIRRLNEGDAVTVLCQVPGQPVSSSVLGETSSVWARTPDGAYVASIYVDAAGFDPLRVSVPCP